jgi:hypothetical protein
MKKLVTSHKIKVHQTIKKGMVINWNSNNFIANYTKELAEVVLKFEEAVNGLNDFG